MSITWKTVLLYFLKFLKTLLLILHLDCEKYLTAKHFYNSIAAIMIWTLT